MNRLVDGLQLLAYYAQARRLQRLASREEIERHQQRRWQWLCANVLVRSPFYAPYACAPLREVPQIDKSGWMANFDRINTAGIRRADAFDIAQEAERSRDFTPTLGGISIGLSTGTSGARGLFLASRQERLRWAGTLLAKMLPQGVLAKARIAMLLRAGNNLYDTLSGGARLQFRFFDLALPLERVWQDLAAFGPTILAAPPSVLALAAREHRAGRIHLAPTRVIAAAEVLEPGDARFVSDTFGVPVEQIYQATEGFLGHSCGHGAIHLNEDCLVVERDWIDRSTGRFAPVVTDLYRHTQPVIRYRLNDVLVERAEPCPCGSPCLALERVEGREDDIVWLGAAAGGRNVPLFADLLSRALLNAAAHIEDYRIEQTGPEHLRVAVSPQLDPSRVPVVAGALRACAERAGALPPRIEFAPLVQQPAVIKTRRVRRLIPVEHAYA
ncbi:F390 synthetase-related protein [Frateuria sp. GZRR35]|uniref:F390 synthetase-related protein n=2 Tax=unclassified Frateuria TaxID=2648894 RepID=UPI003EDC3B03